MIEAKEVIRQVLQKLGKVVAYLEDHPGRELCHKKSKAKLATARNELRTLRHALRDYRDGNRMNAHHAALLSDCDTRITECIPEVEGLISHRFCETVNQLEKTIRQVGLLAPSQLPAFPRLPKSIPNWIPVQLHQDFDEIRKCFQAEANRAVLAFAARMIECALGHRFHRRTGQDPVAENWPLGRLVEESKRKGVLDDVLTPGVEDVLSWVNKTRIASVHVKQKVYQPSGREARLLVELTLELIPQLLSR